MLKPLRQHVANEEPQGHAQRQGQPGIEEDRIDAVENAMCEGIGHDAG